MRILLDLRSVHPGLTGIGRYAENLCLSLDTLNHSIEAHGITTNAGREYLQGRTCATLHVVPAVEGWDDLGLPDLIRALRADLYHTPLFVLPRIRACAYVCTIHDVIPVVRPDLTSPGFAQFFNRHVGHAVKSASHIVTVSEYTRADLLRHFKVDAARVTTVHEPVNPIFAHRSQGGSASELRMLGLTPGFILSVGAIDRRKNLSRLLEAYASLSGKMATPTLAIVGAPSGDEYDFAGDVSSKGLNGKVRMLGRLPDEVLAHVYSAAACLVFPSLYEGFGLPVLEAMASGTPVITSRSSSLPEIAGEAALLVDPVDSSSIEGAIRAILSDKATCESLAKAGLRRAADFTVPLHGAKLHHLYQRLLQSAA